MKQLKVEFSSSGIILRNVAFQVWQGDRVLVEDALSGKLTNTFARSYDVDADDSALSVQLPAGSISGLNVKAVLS